MADEKPVNERVSVLETRMDYHDIVLKESLDRITSVADNLTTQVERTNSILERFEEKLNSTMAKVAKWDTISSTIIKIAIVTSVLIGGAWSLFTFAVDHKDITKNLVVQKG